MLHVEIDQITADPSRLGQAIGYLASEARRAVERRPGSLGTLLMVAPAAGALRFESFWASGRALAGGEDAIDGGVREAARQAAGKVVRERFDVLVFERDAPLHGGEGARVTRLKVAPSRPSKVEDAAAWYGDTLVPQLADTSGFRAALLYADWAAGTLVSTTVWRDQQALAASRAAVAAGEAAATAALDGVLSAAAEYRLDFSSARAA